MKQKLTLGIFWGTKPFLCTRFDRLLSSKLSPLRNERGYSGFPFILKKCMSTARVQANSKRTNRKSKTFLGNLIGFRVYGLQGKLILPYVLLTLLLAAIGTFVVTRLVTSSIRERFINQVYETSRFAGDSIVRQERKQLDDLRLAVFTDGISQALQDQNQQQIEDLLRPIIANRHIQLLTAMNLEGQEIVTIGISPETAQYRRSQGADFSSKLLVQNVLNEIVDNQGDKFAGLVQTEPGWVLFTSAPVKDENGKLTGVLMVGSYLDTILEDIKKQVQADLIVMDTTYLPLSTTFGEPEEGFRTFEDTVQSMPAGSEAKTFDIHLNQRDYTVAYNALIIRNQPLGWMGVLLPENFVISTEATSRDTFSLIFTIGTISVIVVGYFLAQNIAKPILRLSAMAQSVAAGDLSQSIQLKRADEIGDLAGSFDTMTLRLRERTEEAERLYAESLRRNQELAEINARLEAAQLQLIQSEKLAAIGQLTAGIVHDVKNPFAVIMGMSEFLGDDEKLDETTRHGLKVIRESAIKGNRIVSDLLKFARQSAPELKLHDLRETVQTSLRLTTYLTRRFELINEMPEEPLEAIYDAQQMEQVLINMIHNAVQAMPNKGTLRISLLKEGQFARIEIADTGVGIALENLKRVFDPFFTTKPEGEGTGLGLSVSYGIVANHGGQIKVTSEPGKGTCFQIFLPTRQLETSSGEQLL